MNHNCPSVRPHDAESTLMSAMQGTLRRDQLTTALGLENTLRGLQAAIVHITQAEVRRFQTRLGNLDPQQQQAIEQSLQGMAYKILDPVLQSLRTTDVRGDEE